MRSFFCSVILSINKHPDYHIWKSIYISSTWSQADISTVFCRRLFFLSDLLLLAFCWAAPLFPFVVVLFTCWGLLVLVVSLAFCAILFSWTVESFVADSIGKLCSSFLISSSSCVFATLLWLLWLDRPLLLLLLFLLLLERLLFEPDLLWFELCRLLLPLLLLLCPLCTGVFDGLFDDVTRGDVLAGECDVLFWLPLVLLLFEWCALLFREPWWLVPPLWLLLFCCGPLRCCCVVRLLLVLLWVAVLSFNAGTTSGTDIANSGELFVGDVPALETVLDVALFVFAGAGARACCWRRCGGK